MSSSSTNVAVWVQVLDVLDNNLGGVSRVFVTKDGIVDELRDAVKLKKRTTSHTVTRAISSCFLRARPTLPRLRLSRLILPYHPARRAQRR
jgi:hypothetical protein